MYLKLLCISNLLYFKYFVFDHPIFIYKWTGFTVLWSGWKYKSILTIFFFFNDFIVSLTLNHQHHYCFPHHSYYFSSPNYNQINPWQLFVVEGLNCSLLERATSLRLSWWDNRLQHGRHLQNQIILSAIIFGKLWSTCSPPSLRQEQWRFITSLPNQRKATLPLLITFISLPVSWYSCRHWPTSQWFWVGLLPFG